MRWLALCAVTLITLSGCTSDPVSDPGAEQPAVDPVDPSVYGLPETVTGMEYLATADENGTAGIWLHDDTAYLSGGSGLRIYDVTDPAAPVQLAADIENTTGTRDVDILVHPNGRTYAALAHGGATMTLVDVTDPTTPVVVARVSNIGSSHNLAVVPNSTMVYNSISINSNLGPAAGQAASTGKIDIVDFADPENPVVKEFWFPAVIQTPAGVPKVVASTTCHDMTFHEGRQLGYCAGVTDTQVWDISDPWNPAIIQVIDWPGTNIHHGVWATQDGNMLILGDEIAGVAVTVPGCGHDMPTSALWFFDVTDIETPTPLGYYQVSHSAVEDSAEAGAVKYCSTHFGTLVEDRPMMVMGHYSAGTSLIDFTDPMDVQEIALYTAPGTNTWEARYYKGHVYTGDTGRGMEILRIV